MLNMRIYITNILPTTLKNNLNTFVKLFGSPEEKINFEICSKELGMYKIENDIILHMESTYKTDYKHINGYDMFDLLVDKTEYQWLPVVSQLPHQYISTKYYELTFKESKKSNLSLVIECLEESSDFEKRLEPINFYFEYKGTKFDLTDTFFREDFNVFLSALN
jgi:hypothetical protein